MPIVRSSAVSEEFFRDFAWNEEFRGSFEAAEGAYWWLMLGSTFPSRVPFMVLRRPSFFISPPFPSEMKRLLTTLIGKLMSSLSTRCSYKSMTEPPKSNVRSTQ